MSINDCVISVRQEFMDELRISNRLQKVASLVKRGNIVADIGTDHGYLPIYLVKQGITDRVIAMDVRKGPLDKACNNVAEYGVKDSIDIRLSDGLEKLTLGEAQTVTICGMGGKLIQAILERGKEKLEATTQLILSPQSEIRDFRKYLYDNGYNVVAEHMLKEEGQFYLIVECTKGSQNVLKECELSDDLLCETHLRYGKMLLESKCACLYEYLEKEMQVSSSLLEKVSGLKSQEEAVKVRIAQLKKDIQCIEMARRYYD